MNWSRHLSCLNLSLTQFWRERCLLLKAVPKLQAVQRDIAVVVADSVTHAALMSAVWSAPTNGLLRDAQLFDVYRPKPSKSEVVQAGDTDRSLAVRLTLLNDEATLADEQIEATVKAVVDQLVARVGARQRV
jgi:phenylalanyl-tRNA synthetase beta chain